MKNQKTQQNNSAKPTAPKKKPRYKPNVMMSIHGYFSKGIWQDTLSTTLSLMKLKSAPFKYGFKISPFGINKEVTRFRDWYFNVVQSKTYDLKIEQPFHRPSIMAHSLGSLIVAKAIQKYPEMKFDKIFLFGAIVPSDFDWFKLILNDQVDTVIYEKSKKDKVVPWSFIFTGSLSPCSTYGFLQKSSFIKEDDVSLFGHSDFQYQEHFKTKISHRLKERPHQLKVIEGGTLSIKEVKNIFEETLEIDRSVFDNVYQDAPIDISQALKWFDVEKDIWSFVVNVFTDDVLGYINAIPVNDNTYNDFVNNKLKEQHIRPSDILSYENCDSYNLLILSIAFRNEEDEDTVLRKARLLQMMLMSFIYKIDRFKSDKINLKKFAAVAWSIDGERLCKGFGMKNVGTDEGGHKIYEMDLENLNLKDIEGSNFMCKWWYKNILKLKSLDEIGSY